MDSRKREKPGSELRLLALFSGFPVALAIAGIFECPAVGLAVIVANIFVVAVMVGGR